MGESEPDRGRKEWEARVEAKPLTPHQRAAGNVAWRDPGSREPGPDRRQVPLPWGAEKCSQPS